MKIDTLLSLDLDKLTADDKKKLRESLEEQRQILRDQIKAADQVLKTLKKRR